MNPYPARTLSVIRRLLQTKSLDELMAETEEPGHRLKRALGPWNILALGVGAIIGAGIFAAIGTAAAGDAPLERGYSAVLAAARS